jgi:tetratricopeptide (TPR) repeat protein
MLELEKKVFEALKVKNPALALKIVEKSDPLYLSRPLYYSLRGDIFTHQILFDRAVSEYQKALTLTPDFASAHNGLGNALIELADYDRALAAFDRAVQLAPNIGEFAFNRAQLRLLRGDWSGAKADYERRLLSPDFQVHADIARRPAWVGSAVGGQRVLLYWEQGHGDTLQFVRYAHRLEALGARVIIEAQKPLLRLLRASFPKAEVIGSGDVLPEFDVRAAIPSLPWIFGELPAAVYAPSPYLAVPGEVAPLGLVAGRACSAGLVWAGNPNHINDKQRSLPQEAVLELTNLSGFIWYSLQVGASDKAKRALARAGVTDLTLGFTDFAETAAAIQALDLVITVDTSVAHLAGALGKPVWILLPFVPDWRWLLDRSDSPWYPSARLFRQLKRGDWASVLKAVKRALVEFRDQRDANSAA